MKKVVLLLGASAVALSLSGCIYIDGEVDGRNWESRERDNREHINQLRLGEERSKVQMHLGTPDFSEAFTLSDDEYRVLYYRTQRSHSDGDTSKDETTPLIFKNNRLMGWGYDTLLSIKR